MAPRKAAAKTEESKTATAVETVKEAVKATAKKAAAKKTTSTRKTSKKAAEPVVEVFVEHNGVQVPLNEVIESVKAGSAKDAKEIKIYLKPEDNAAYYVADGEQSQIKVYFC